MWTLVSASLWTLMVILGSVANNSGATKFNPLMFPGGDKMAHFVAYMIMVLLWGVVLSKRGSRVGGARIAFYGAVILGLILEICQGLFFESRSFEIADIIANIMGSILGLILFYKFF